MPYPQLDRSRLKLAPLGQRSNKLDVARDHLDPDSPPRALAAEAEAAILESAARIREARRKNRAVILAFGAHTIKNGLGSVLGRLVERGWLTHLATNGAGIIHDWEFAWQGKSGEDVRRYVHQGQFGIWQETGFHLNLALVAGAYEGLGYGESVGAMIEREGIVVPSLEELRGQAIEQLDHDPQKAAAAADFAWAVRRFELQPGVLKIPHPFKSYSVQTTCHRLGVPFTGHPMIGHDIIYEHPLNNCAALGRAAERDFLSFANSVSGLEDGVYLSVGSAVMSPMIFEKSLSMVQNLLLQEGRRMERHHMVVVDLAPMTWDWQRQGEPPLEHPAYYMRYLKTFSRMGGSLRYVSCDNRDFLLGLSRALAAPAP